MVGNFSPVTVRTVMAWVWQSAPASASSSARSMELGTGSGERGFHQVTALRRANPSCSKQTYPALVAATLAESRRQVEDQLADLERERRGIERDVARHSADIRELVGVAHSEPGTARLADLQERLRLAENRFAEIQAAMAGLQGQLIDEDELRTVLSRFDPVWEALSMKERARVLELLIERVDFDGGEGTISLAFRPNGIGTLASEFGETA